LTTVDIFIVWIVFSFIHYVNFYSAVYLPLLKPCSPDEIALQIAY